MQTTALVKFVVDKIEDMKGRDVAVLDVHQQSTITDHMVVCSGNSKRHVQSIAQNILNEAKLAHLTVIGSEGGDAGEWVLVDLGDVVIHVMQDESRDFYQLEKLWKPQTESRVG
ncbi:ribosome silencing factor [Celerinatantimonas yamalensis]|uniref:Ribosomal silencing factor RsfS n=1 Tax=Celerinatantimonas yamalensis TaxID=559956 RepID=A0ABW9GCC3_9GAMM